MSLNPEPIPVGRLREVRHVALDMDGTIYKGGTLFPFTRPFLDSMKAIGIGCTFLTNNSSKSVADYLAHLKRIGIEATREQMVTSTLATIRFLHEALPKARRLFVLGTESLQEEFRSAGFEVVEDEPDAVVVGFDTGLVYTRLCQAAWWISQGKPFIATHPDLTCPTDKPTVLVDCGAVTQCLTASTGVRPLKVLGKPDPCMLTEILKTHDIDATQLAMVGDRLSTDMAMARRTGALGVLVLTGEATREDVAGCAEPPDVVFENLGEFGKALVAARGKQSSP